MLAPDRLTTDSNGSGGAIRRIRRGLTSLFQAPAGLRGLLARPERAPVPLIGVGSMMTAGAGRLPLERAVVRRLSALGRRPHVLLTGVGGRLRGPIRVDTHIHRSRDVGDEALMLSADGPVWVARDLRAGVKAAADAGADAIVLDDGARGLPFIKDLWIVAADAEQDLGTRPPAPGSHRELPDGFARADAMVLIGEGEAEPLQSAARAAGLEVLRANVLALNASELAGRRLVAFAGIAQPEKAFATLRRAGADVAAEVAFPNHHPYSAEDWDRLLALAEESGAELVTTEKDAARLPADWRRRAWIMRIQLRFEAESQLDALLVRAGM